ncbi:MAG: PIN domain nuclease [Pyrinomonadaceae bacterium]
MILVDSSVWIDYFRGTNSRQTDTLDRLFGLERIVIGDLITTEVLQGVSSDKQFNEVRGLFDSLDFVVLSSKEIALQAALNFRKLRTLGFTVRKTIDTIIATRCIVSGLNLLHNDRDFEPFEKHLGLKCL